MNILWSDLVRAHADVAYPLGVLLAALVTIHVLLRKRMVASAVGWIGLAWFAPTIGALAYVILGINRVQRRARSLRPGDNSPANRQPTRLAEGHDDHLDPLARGIGRITGRPLLTASAIDVFHDGDEAYPPMLDAIAAAEASIGLTSYIFTDDTWGQRFIDALAAAHARGVTVRVIIDGIGGGWLRSGAYHRLVAAGVPAARFLHSPLPWRMPFLNLRCHKKLLVIDGRIGFTGGVNIAAQNVLAETPADPVQDTHFRIQGPIVCQLTEAFAEDWSFVAGEDLNGDAWFPPQPQSDSADAAPARIIDSGPDESIEKIELAVLQAIACARTRIMVMTPYFLPDERLVSALSLAAMRGVAVDVVIPEVSDHVLVAWAVLANSRPLLVDGVRIWHAPPPFRHSKVVLVDEEWVLIGSANWDSRSFRLNFELCMELYDAPLAATLATLIRGCMAKPLTVESLDARPVLQRLRDAAARLLLPYI